MIAQPGLQVRVGQHLTAYGEVDRADEFGDQVVGDADGTALAIRCEPSGDVGDPAAEPAADPVAEGLLTGEQCRRVRGAVLVEGEFDVVDLADGFAVAVEDLPVEQVEATRW